MIANLIYFAALALVLPVVIWRSVRHGRYRRGISQRLLGLNASDARRLTGGGEGCLWVHAVSVGEVNLIGGLITELESRYPERRVVISTSTDTGYDIAVKRFGTERVFFMPLDFTWAVRRTFAHLQPDALALAELELWPNLIRFAGKASCPVYVVNARLSDRSCRGYLRFGFLTRRIFQALHWVGAQDDAAAANFAACGTPTANIEVTGSMKFDDAPTSRDTAAVRRLRAWAGASKPHRIWCVGSTQPGEEAMALRIYDRLRRRHPELRLILVPRHAPRFDQVAYLVGQNGLSVRRRSDPAVPSNAGQQWTSDTVILVDTIGELRDWWGLCEIATVGGSFGNRGGQNMLEPAGYGAAVSFGPDTRNFHWIADALVEQDAAARVADESALEEFLLGCLVDPSRASRMGAAAGESIRRRRGATAKTLAAIRPQISPTSPAAFDATTTRESLAREAVTPDAVAGAATARFRRRAA